MDKLFVISKVADTDQVEKYYSIDSSSGYACWDSFLTHAKLFKSREEATENLLTSSNFCRRSKMTDGTIYPPRLIHSGALINNKLESSGMTVWIKQINLEIILETRFTGKIERPQG